MAKPRYTYLTQAQIVERIGQHPALVCRKVKLYGLKKNKSGKYNYTLYLERYREELAQQSGLVSEVNGRPITSDIRQMTGEALKDEKVRRDITKLDIQIDEMRGRLIEIAPVREAMALLAQMFSDGLDHFVSFVEAEYEDPHAVKVAQNVSNDIRSLVRRKQEEYVEGAKRAGAEVT